MQINWQGKDKIIIKSKNAVIETGEVNKVNEVELLGPGEYEIAGIEIFGISEGIYLFRIEDMTVAYLDKINRTLTDKEIEDLSDVAIVIIPTGGEGVIDAKAAANIIKSVEPKIVIPTNSENFADFCKIIGGCQDPRDNIKITKQQLIEQEGQKVYLLKVS